MDYQDWKRFVEAIRFSAEAHQEHVLPDAKANRGFPSGERNPYFTHPLWCTMMLLLDTQLPASIREPGAYALLWHDVLEDTSLSLPEDTTKEVRDFVDEMTVKVDSGEKRESAWEQERAITLTRPPVIQLLRLYDKVATLYDGCIRRGKKLQEWIELTEKLIANVEKEYGELNIVLLGKALVEKYQRDQNETTA